MPSEKLDDPHTDKVLLVEGSEDVRVVGHILDKHGYHDGCDILDFQGYDRLLKEFRFRIRAGNQSVIGLIVDADANFKSRWASIKKVLHDAGYRPLPDRPEPSGIMIIQSGKPTVGIWIMPDNASSGMLEDFAVQLLPGTDTLWERAVAAVDGIPKSERQFAEVHRSKANLRTWLAWQAEPGMPIGLAIKKGRLDHNALASVALKDWLVALFDLKHESELA